jgi:hypothetical protein
MPAVRHRRHPSTLRARWALGLALWALVLGQWLALAHAIGHPAGLRAGVRAELARATAQDAAQGPAHGPSLLQFVTAHADGSPACQLFDELAQPSPVLLPPPAPLLVLAQHTPAPPLQDGRRREPPGLFHARAPPAFA